MNRKTEKKVLFFNLFQIFIILLLSYVIMVFISHFSVYGSTENYHISDSFKAMLLKTDVPAQFFLFFGIFVSLTVAIALIINLLTKKLNEHKRIKR